MEQEIEELIAKNDVIKGFLELPKEELELIRMYINLELITINRPKDKAPSVRAIRACLNDAYNYLDYILSFRCDIENSIVSTENSIDRVKSFILCACCNCKKACLIKNVTIFMDEIVKYDVTNAKEIKYIDVIDYILNRKAPQFKKVPEQSFFKSVDKIDLLYVQSILEADLISIVKYDENEKKVECNYLNLTQKNNNEYYVNKLLSYYKNSASGEHLTLDLNDMDNIFKEKDRFARVYKIAAYYKYLIEIEKIDIILKLREIFKNEDAENDMKMRSHYFVYKSFRKVEELPYSKKTKEKIYNILNYILNYRYKEGIPFVPINILFYSNDKEGVEKITTIIGEFMWFFGYLAEDMRYYSEYINNVILDKFLIKKLYYDNNDNAKSGTLLLHNFENLLYTDHMQQNLILNILTDEMEKNNTRVCTIIYGEREMLKQILGNHHKLFQRLINLELEIDKLDVEQINNLLIEKLEKSIVVSEEVKQKIYNYIKATYKQSDIKDMEYVNRLYNLIVLNVNNTFSLKKKQELKEEDIPEAYNTRDLPTIMKDLNGLVGLKEIKEQINDLVALLKFNKKVNLDIKNFNLHMIFSGNPGTGKTTVGRLITDIFYNLGYINQNKITEVTAKDLIAEYIGQTSGKTYNVVKSALGGVLFIDEAYAITLGTGNGAQFGNECIATLLKLMEDYKDKLVIIFAGYKNEMKHFQEANPGLISRIGYRINFPDFTLDELTQIYLNLLEKNKLKITDEALLKLKDIIKESSTFEHFGNGRYINTVFQNILIEHSKNIEKGNKDADLYLITKEDIRYEKLIAENEKGKRKIGF